MRLTMSAIGTKRTYRVAPHMSAFDPKRTVRAYYRSGIDLAEVHNAVAANNKARLNFDLII